MSLLLLLLFACACACAELSSVLCCPAFCCTKCVGVAVPTHSLLLPPLPTFQCCCALVFALCGCVCVLGDYATSWQCVCVSTSKCHFLAIWICDVCDWARRHTHARTHTDTPTSTRIIPKDKRQLWANVLPALVTFHGCRSAHLQI